MLHRHRWSSQITPQHRKMGSKYECVESINIRTDGDTETPEVVDVAVLSVKGSLVMVVSDHNNNCLKSFYTKDGRKYNTKVMTKEKPLGLAKLSSNRIAAAVSPNRIVLVEATPDLQLLSVLETCRQYRGLAALTDLTIAAASLTFSIDILDMDGCVLRSVSVPDTGQEIVPIPYYICASQTGNILVSDYGSKFVYCLSPDGEVVFADMPRGERSLQHPRGITVTNSGDIFLADWGANVIIHLSEDGQFVRHVLSIKDGIIKPYGLCVDDQDQLYVCLKGEVKVFGRGPMNRVDVM
ncbi:tripartite motif-containing protein 3-like [Haliotis rubra]|uniref:tripartite motif-containing protein 3-like n=1 Tax=Haliotis rubra TaxID=36100 RepID=UPI001EE6131E|nr:tripartite motif-containing protein 3-like [Haliotis rubra]